MGDAEVGELGHARGGARRVRDDHVLRLDVAVHDAAAVRVLERAAQREADPQHVAVAQRALGAQLVQRAPVDELGDQVAGPGVLAGVEDRDDARVVEAPGGQRLAAAALGVAAGRRRDDLDRHGALQALVGGGVDGSEAARAEPRTEPVAAEDELCVDNRGELVRGLHQARFRRDRRRSLRTPCHAGSCRDAAEET